MKQSGADAVELLTVLGAFALGAQRILPLLQQVYSSWAQTWALTSQVNDFMNMIEVKEIKIKREEKNKRIKSNQTSKNQYIELQGVKYKYTNTNTWVLNNINLIINKGERIGFIGKTGCGKSTLLDIIMGLLPPTHGRLIVSGNEIGENLEDYKGEKMERDNISCTARFISSR